MNDRNGRSIHFIGIGGIGMSALARWFLAENWSVSGSDLETSPLTAELAKEGVKLKIGALKTIPGQPSVVVHTNAVSGVSPDKLQLLDAKKRGLNLFSYPQMVGEISRRYETIAISGAHGKSTTTAMIALILMRSGLDPTVLIGTKLRELNGKNFRAGRSGYLVLEADEYAKAFLNYSPTHLIVTNIDREHLDTYRNIADIKKTFMQMFSQVQAGGSLILNADDRNLSSMKKSIGRLAKHKDLQIYWYSAKGLAAGKVRAVLKIPGTHNTANALAAMTLAVKVFGLPQSAVLKVIGTYTGSWRRYDHKGRYKMAGVSYDVFDDYAHHPTEITATLSGFREKFPKSAVICVFQPHQAERLKKLFKDFEGSFKNADAVILVPAYHVAGREALESKYTAEALAGRLAKNNSQTVLYLKDPKLISKKIIQEALAGSKKKTKSAVVIMMGAGTIADYTPLLLQSTAHK